MKKKLKEGRFKTSGQAELVAPVIDQQPQPPEGGGVTPSPESQWSLDPKYKIYPQQPRKFKGPQGGTEFVPPNFDQGGGGGTGGGGSGGGKNVPYPDMPDIKPCNPISIRYMKRCPDYYVELGCGGQNVQDIQAQLIRKNMPLPKWKVDCKFGYETEQAVKIFQEKMGITNDGIVNNLTRKLLFQVKNPASETNVIQGSEDPKDYQEEFRMTKKRKFKKVQENLNRSYTLDRYQQIEDLVFERLVKNAS